MTKDETRERIIEAALTAISEHGADFHMDDLAKNLHISKRTLYEYFSSKQEIIKTALMSISQDMYEKHVRLVEDKTLSAEEKLLRFFALKPRYYPYMQMFTARKVNNLLERMPEVYHMLCLNAERDWELLDDILQQGFDRGEFHDVDKKLFIHMVHSAANDIINYLDDVKGDSTFSDYMSNCISVILYGIKKR